MSLRLSVLPLSAAALVLASQVCAQDTTRSTSTTGAGATTRSTSTTTRGSTARGPLPDPALLDGSTMPAEKRPEYGMLGDFEIPGDENSTSDKVGGQQPPPGQKGGGGQQGQQKQDGSQQGGMQGIPGMQGGGGGSQDAKQQAGGKPAGAGGQQAQQDGKQQGGGAGGAEQQDKNAAQNGSGGPGGGPNDPNAKAEGQQVAGLSGDAATAGGPDVANVPKPTPVKIGDPAMQIKTVSNAAGIVGAQPAGTTQQMEKATGTGGGSKGSPGDNSNRGVEKGRAMPAGL